MGEFLEDIGFRGAVGEDLIAMLGVEIRPGLDGGQLPRVEGSRGLG